MATQQEPSLSNIDQMVTCPLCKQIYNSPVALKCLHVFCKECILKEFSDNSTICCPIATCGKRCKNTQVSPDTRTEELMRLFKLRIDEKRRIDTTEIRCQLCKKKEAKWICHECDDTTTFICAGTCAELHRTVKDLRHHALINIEEVKHERQQELKQILGQWKAEQEICQKHIKSSTANIQSSTESTTRVCQKLKQSEEMWIRKVKEIHQTMIGKVTNKSETVLRPTVCKNQELLEIDSRICNEIQKLETAISENTTRTLLEHYSHEQLHKETAEFSRQITAVTNQNDQVVNIRFNAMKAQAKQNLENVICTTLQEQLQGNFTTATSAYGAQTPDPHPLLNTTVKPKSEGSPSTCSLKRIVKSRHLVHEHVYQFQKVSSPKRLRFIDDQLWIVISGGKIVVLNFNGSEIEERSISVHRDRRDMDSLRNMDQLHYYVTSIAKIRTGVVAALGRSDDGAKTCASSASNPGLVVLNSNGLIQTEIMKGSFLDVCVDGTTVYGLTNPNENEKDDGQTIHILHHRRHKWTCVQIIPVKDKATRMLAVENILYLTGTSDTVIKYDMKSKTTESMWLTKRQRTMSAAAVASNTSEYRFVESNWSPSTHNAFLCFADPQGNVLVVDFKGNSLTVLSTSGHWYEMPIQGVEGPWDADMDGNGGIWLIASGEQNAFALYKICTGS